MKFTYLILLLLLTTAPAIAQDTSLYEAKEFVKGGDTLKYRMLMPKNFNPASQYPVLIFLHGAGERGDDNKAQLTHGATLFLQDSVRANFPAVVIFPQCPADSYWSNVKIETTNNQRTFNFQQGGKPTPPMKLLMALVKEMQSEPYADKNRMYLAGLSMGGMGTFELLARKPKVFAAAIPICGGGSPERVKKYAKRVNMWVFHGADDPVVPVSNSDRMVSALKSAGANIKYTIYPGVGHESWNNAFAEPQLLPWLFASKKQ